VQTAETVGTWMRWLLLTQPTGLVLGMFCILAYPLTPVRLLDVQQQLARRRPLSL